MLQVMSYRKLIADAFPEFQVDKTWIRGCLIRILYTLTKYSIC
jgi:hypothetical protein